MGPPCPSPPPLSRKGGGNAGDCPRTGVDGGCVPSPAKKYRGQLLVPVHPGCSASGRGAWERGSAETQGCGGARGGVTPPAPHSGVGGIPCAREGREWGVSVGQGDLGPARGLLAVGCAYPPVGSISLQESCFYGEDYRGEVACGAKWGLSCWVRGTWRLQHFLCVRGLGVGAPFPPAPELDREQALLPETSSFLPMGCGCDCVQAVWVKCGGNGGCLPRRC